jgi:hypothetical protein
VALQQLGELRRCGLIQLEPGDLAEPRVVGPRSFDQRALARGFQLREEPRFLDAEMRLESAARPTCRANTSAR